MPAVREFMNLMLQAHMDARKVCAHSLPLRLCRGCSVLHGVQVPHSCGHWWCCSLVCAQDNSWNIDPEENERNGRPASPQRLTTDWH